MAEKNNASKFFIHVKNPKKPIFSAQEIYPRLVNDEKVSFFQRLMARLGSIPVKGQIFIGYCRVHKKYFLDHKHTNDVIRCPICDVEWLNQHDL